MKTATITKFKETELGLIPEEWAVKSLGDVLEITSSKRIFMSEYVDAGVPFYRGKEIIEKANGNRNISTPLFISEKRFSEITEKFGAPKEGDILMSSVGTLGVSYQVGKDENFYFKDGNLTWFRNYGDGVYPEYIQYWLKSPAGQRSILSGAIGSTQPALTIDGLKKILLAIPTVDEQKQISEIVSSLDSKIEHNRNINANLEKLAGSLFKKWFIDIGDDLPEGWKITELKNILELNYGKALKAEDRVPGKIKVYGSSGTVGFNDKKLVDGPGIIVGRKGNVGSVFWSNDDFYAIDTTYYVKSKFPLTYCYFLLKNQTFINGDSVVPGLNRDQAYRTEVVLPSIDVLEKFDVIASDLIKSIAIIDRETENLSLIRDSLLPRLMSGKIRVNI